MSRPRDIQKDIYAKRYRLSEVQHHKLGRKLIEQLERCADDAARRLILGVSR
jgi:histone acetyltransferase (RNA polymerase elongator complex component)